MAGRKSCSQLPLRRLDQRDHALAGLRAGDARKQRVRQHDDFDRQAAHMGFGGPEHAFGGEHRLDLAIAAQRLFQQVEGLGHAPALFGESAAGDRAPHILQQRVGRARDRFRLRHSVYNVILNDQNTAHEKGLMERGRAGGLSVC